MLVHIFIFIFAHSLIFFFFRNHYEKLNHEIAQPDFIPTSEFFKEVEDEVFAKLKHEYLQKFLSSSSYSNLKGDTFNDTSASVSSSTSSSTVSTSSAADTATAIDTTTTSTTTISAPTLSSSASVPSSASSVSISSLSPSPSSISPTILSATTTSPVAPSTVPKHPPKLLRSRSKSVNSLDIPLILTDASTHTNTKGKVIVDWVWLSAKLYNISLLSC